MLLCYSSECRMQQITKTLDAAVAEGEQHSIEHCALYAQRIVIDDGCSDRDGCMITMPGATEATPGC